MISILQAKSHNALGLGLIRQPLEIFTDLSIGKGLQITFRALQGDFIARLVCSKDKPSNNQHYLPKANIQRVNPVLAHLLIVSSPR